MDNGWGLLENRNAFRNQEPNIHWNWIVEIAIHRGMKWILHIENRYSFLKETVIQKNPNNPDK